MYSVSHLTDLSPFASRSYCDTAQIRTKTAKSCKTGCNKSCFFLAWLLGYSCSHLFELNVGIADFGARFGIQLGSKSHTKSSKLRQNASRDETQLFSTTFYLSISFLFLCRFFSLRSKEDTSHQRSKMCCSQSKTTGINYISAVCHTTE